MKQNINQKGLTNIEDMKAEVVNYWDTMIFDLSSLIEIMPRRTCQRRSDKILTPVPLDTST